MSDNRYEPDTVLPPGETLREILAEVGMSLRLFGERVGLDAIQVGALLDGEMRIDGDLARRLEDVTGASAIFWRNLDANYMRRRDTGRPR